MSGDMTKGMRAPEVGAECTRLGGGRVHPGPQAPRECRTTEPLEYPKEGLPNG